MKFTVALGAGSARAALDLKPKRVMVARQAVGAPRK
jgi:hypothetical protein